MYGGREALPDDTRHSYGVRISHNAGEKSGSEELQNRSRRRPKRESAGKSWMGRVANNPGTEFRETQCPEDFRVSGPQQGAVSILEGSQPTRSVPPYWLLYDLIKTLIQRAAGDRPELVPVFFRVSRIRVRIGCLRALPFFDNREMIRSHRVL